MGWGMPGWGLGTETSAPEVSPRERAWGGGVERKLLGRSRKLLTTGQACCSFSGLQEFLPGAGSPMQLIQ